MKYCANRRLGLMLIEADVSKTTDDIRRENPFQ